MFSGWFTNSAGLNSSWSDGDDHNTLANVGEKVSHICTVENVGTTSLGSFCITGDSFKEGCQNCSEAGTLAPGATFTCTIETEVSACNSKWIVLCCCLFGKRLVSGKQQRGRSWKLRPWQFFLLKAR